LQFPNSNFYPEKCTSSEPTIGIDSNGDYVVAYATDVRLDSGYQWTPGRGLIGLSTYTLPSPPGLIVISVGDDPFGEPLTSATPYLHSPSISPDASYVSFCSTNAGLVATFGASITGSGTGIGLVLVNPLDEGGLFQYHPSVSGEVGSVNEGVWNNQFRTVFRAGNNKNGDIRLFTSTTLPYPSGASNIFTLSDQDSDSWRDDRGHDSGMDISNDGCGIVWTSARYSTGDIYFIDLRYLDNEFDDADSNAEILSNIVRLTTSGAAIEPQISNFIPLGPT
jgi:hypothetical protein